MSLCSGDFGFSTYALVSIANRRQAHLAALGI